MKKEKQYFPPFGEEYVRNCSERYRGRWQIPIHLVKVAFPNQLYNIDGLRLSLGEPAYPITRRCLKFYWEPPQPEYFPRLIRHFDNGDEKRFLDLESLITSFACGRHLATYPKNSRDDLVRLFQRHCPNGMETFNQLCYYYHRRHKGTTIATPQSRWDLSLFFLSIELLMLAVSPKTSNGHYRENRDELISLTSICRQKTINEFNNPLSRSAGDLHP